MNSFRLRFVVSSRTAINCEENSLHLVTDEGGQDVFLRARTPGRTIKEDDNLVLRSAGWSTDTAAREAAEGYRDALILALARCRVGGDLGDRAAKGSFTSYGLAMLEKQQGQRVLNDQHGMMIFGTEPPLQFVSQQMKGTRGVPPDRFVEAFTAARARDVRLEPAARLAFEFFSASFFTDYADARFLLLFMAVEALIEQRERPERVVAFVDEVEELVRGSAKLEQDDKSSLLGSIKWLKVESIRQAGRTLASTTTAEYSGMSGEDIFLSAYDLRNQLVHGLNRPGFAGGSRP